MDISFLLLFSHCDIQQGVSTQRVPTLDFVQAGHGDLENFIISGAGCDRIFFLFGGSTIRSLDRTANAVGLRPESGRPRVYFHQGLRDALVIVRAPNVLFTREQL